jgi:hypothetical protein
VSDPRWLDGYGGQGTEALLALDGEFRTDSVVAALEQGIAQKAERLGGLAALTDEERVVLAVEALERAVNNDGYDGLLRYSAVHIPGLVAALTAIGEERVAALTQRAIDTVGIVGPVTPEAVVAAMDRDDADRDDRLSACDAAYYASAGDLAGPVLTYVRAHQDRIVLP